MANPASKNQPEAKRNEASVAVTLCFKMADMGKANALSKSKSESDRVCSKGAQPAGESPVTAMREAQGDHAAWGNRRLTNSPDRFTADLSLREPGVETAVECGFGEEFVTFLLARVPSILIWCVIDKTRGWWKCG